MALTAFQSNAFQDNAFQIFDTHDGGINASSIKRKHLMHLKRMYKSISVELPQSPRIIAAIDPFIEPETEQEMDRRVNARHIVDVAPKAKRIDFRALYINELAREQFLKAIEAAKAQIKALREQQNEEIILLIMMMEV